MTTPTPNAVPPMDPGNGLLALGPAQLTTTEVMIGGEKFAATTIRTASTTVTVFLNRDDLQAWASNLQKAADAMSGLAVVRSMPPAGLNGAQQP